MDGIGVVYYLGGEDDVRILWRKSAWDRQPVKLSGVSAETEQRGTAEAITVA